MATRGKPGLRQQLAIFKRKKHHPRLSKRDRIFWVLLSNFWKDWRKSLQVVRLETSYPLALTGIQDILEL